MLLNKMKFVLSGIIVVSAASMVQAQSRPVPYDPNRPYEPARPASPQYPMNPGPNQPLPSCNQDEVNAIAQRAEHETLDRVRSDLRAEGRVSSAALGVDERDCIERAAEKARSQSNVAIDACIQQTTYFRTCEVAGQRVIGVPDRLKATLGIGQIDDRQTDENGCKQNAQNKAIENAMRICESQFSQRCQIVSGPSEATHRVERRRRFGIMGPKEDYHICESRAEALPATREQFQCTVEIFAKVRL